MKPDLSDGWYAFHFGSKFANAPDFDPESLFKPGQRECCVLVADFCSFTTFIRATENLKTIEPLLTSFYTQARKIIHKHSGMLYQIVGDSVVGVWGLHASGTNKIGAILEAAEDLTAMTNKVANDWQSHIDLLAEPKGLRVGLAKGAIVVVRRDGVYPGLLLFGNPINLASRLQAAAQANQLVCSNSAYKEIEETGLAAPFQPYRSHSQSEFVDAKNYGPLKAWVRDLMKPGG